MTPGRHTGASPPGGGATAPGAAAPPGGCVRFPHPATGLERGTQWRRTFPGEGRQLGILRRWLTSLLTGMGRYSLDTEGHAGAGSQAAAGSQATAGSPAAVDSHARARGPAPGPVSGQPPAGTAAGRLTADG